ncbi:hypothetical protein P154DRAFT_574948 [Amniculicola lignicola CBS 123094]|uniref:WSC domain-containing protein n=1 Tax=Amniculicola lignicola CBS 123094 TaxID=1392246 RepID=A0A6A5WI76_9PLEO|nr:hypothetical protein P154DRAFT_574948 [Amniculicola lignicola CBS 123094]
MAIAMKSLLSAFVALLAFLITSTPMASASNTPSYCSSQNTGSDTDPFFWTWQSNGKCGDHCRGDYAYGVILDKQCWCSNYAPAEQVDLSKCGQDCPGFPSEKCGNPSDKLYIYVLLDTEPSGTASAAQSTSPGKTSTTLETSVTSDSSQNTTPIQSVRTITQNNGETIRETIILPPTGTAAAGKKKGTPTGAIAGGVVGGILGLALIIGAVIFFLRRRRQQQDEQDAQSGIQRNTSTMSRSGLLGHREKPNPPAITTTLNHNSRIGFDHESVSPVSGSDRRNSRPYIFDQRLNPSAIMAMDNTSRGSVASLDDSRDYGRELNVRNPDPDPPEVTRP